MPAIRWSVKVVLCVMLLAYGAVAADARDCHTRTEQVRPLELGVSGGNLDSIGHRYCCGGTLGSLVQDDSGTEYILSNNHVLATADNAPLIIQPGLVDSRCRQRSDAIIGEGVQSVHISSRVNVVDAAIGQVSPDQVDAEGGILNIGKVAAGRAVTPALGLKVQKMGRTTCLTRGTIKALDVTIRVRYPNICNGQFHGIAVFTQQIQIKGSGFSAAGDSGSLIVTTGSCPGAVGLLFAGSATSTFANPMGPVLRAFPANLSMVGNTCTPTKVLAATELPQTLSEPRVAAAAAVKQRHDQELLAIPGVVGSGIGLSSRGRTVIKVYVEKDTPEIRGSLSPDLEGVPVEVEETGPIIAY